MARLDYICVLTPAFPIAVESSGPAELFVICLKTGLCSRDDDR